jgi:diguanylate cyclase (GGDEF)-like protein
MVKETKDKYNSELNVYFYESVELLHKRYTLVNDIITTSHTTLQMIKNRDRVALHKSMSEYYNKLQTQDPHLYVMHFFDTKNTTILRMHKPESFDDDLSQKRPIVKYVNSSKKQSHGFEVGKNGITYRVTSPVLYNNKHIGALEFGIKPTYFADKMEKKFNAKTLVLVKSDTLNVLSKKKEFKTKNSYSIIEKDPLFNTLLDFVDLSKESQVLTHKDRTYLALNNLALNSYDNKELARIVVLKDITKYIKHNDQLIIFSSLINFVALFCIGFIIYFMLSRYTSSLQELENANRVIKQKAKKYKNKANTDHLTKLYNREFLDKYFSTHSFLDEKDNVCIIFDIDHFKNVNDNYGHDVGDEILRHLATLSKSFFRDEDILVRYGGEEFLIIIEHIDYEDAYKKAEEFRSYIDKNRSFYNNIHITLSLGITKFKPYENKADIIKRADIALYKAKNNGRNQVVKT